MTALLPLLLAAWPSVQLDGFPHVQQKPDFCGEADVEMALRRLGRNVTQDDVFNVSGLDPLKGRGVHADELAHAMKALGVEPGQVWYRIDPKKAASQVEAQWSALHKDLVAGNPSIVCMHYDASPDTTEHFRLVTGYDARADEVIYEEPADGTQQRMKRSAFLSLMTFKPAKDRWTVIVCASNLAAKLRRFPSSFHPRPPSSCST
ncbi:MAG: C39 family peptidase [Archangium sp.]